MRELAKVQRRPGGNVGRLQRVPESVVYLAESLSGERSDDREHYGEGNRKYAAPRLCALPLALWARSDSTQTMAGWPKADLNGGR